MKTLINIFIGIVTITSYGQQNSYNDWFDFNLKGEPKSIKEILINSLTDTTYFNMPYDLKVLSAIDIYLFDSLGFIIKDFNKWPFSPLSDRWRDYSNKEVIDYKDSVITNYCDTTDYYHFQIKRYYDNDGFLIKKVIPDNPDTFIYLRDSYHKIIFSYIHGIGIDSDQINEVRYSYNSNGDIIIEKRHDKTYFVDSENPYVEDLIYEYQYIYDSYSNWIIRVCLKNNEISTITQREIIYK